MALTDKLTNIADAIRNKTNTTDTMTLEEMPSKIENIVSSITTNLQDKSINITENGTTNIVADEGYDGLNNVEVTTNVKTGSGVSSLNIYMQEDEPETKDGIWLQTNYIYDEISNFTEYTTSKIVATYNNAARYAASAVVGDTIYVFGGSKGSASSPTNTAYKFNTTNNTASAISNYPQTFNMMCASAIETDIYIFGGRNSSNAYQTKSYKYDTLTDSYTDIASMPSARGYASAVTVGTDIYIIGGNTIYGSAGKYYNDMLKYDTVTDQYTTINMPVFTNNDVCEAFGTDIYIFGGSTNTPSSAYSSSHITYKYDTLNGVFVMLSDAPLQQTNTISTIDNETIYLANTGGKYSTVEKYNTLADVFSYTQQGQRDSSTTFGQYHYVNGKFYYMGGLLGSSVDTNIYCVTVLDCDEVYEKNTLIISQDPGHNMFSTKLSSDTSEILVEFDDVKYYNITDGFVNNIPTYYGDGIKWIKFKN